jgi:hypothetical protein
LSRDGKRELGVQLLAAKFETEVRTILDLGKYTFYLLSKQ